MNSPLRFGRALSVAAVAVTLLALPHTASAQQVPTYLLQVSASGDYLAGRHASTERDALAAANYYRAALRSDPRNVDLLSRAFLAELTAGNIEEAFDLARRTLKVDDSDRIAHLVLGVGELKHKRYAQARAQLAESIHGPITDLAATVLSGWAAAGAKDAQGAVRAIDKLTGPDWYGIFKDLHAGMIFDANGRRAEAGKRFESAYKLDPSALRVVQAYGSWLSRNDGKDKALAVYAEFQKTLPDHPLILEAVNQLKAGRELPAPVETPQDGAAELLYGLGAALGRRGGEDLGLVYLQLALYLAPTHALAQLSLADLYETIKKPELAIRTYERIPQGSPLWRNAQIQMALNLDSVDRTEEAQKNLRKLITGDAHDTEAIVALGNILRGRKQFADCADTYAKAIDNIPKPEKQNWVVFYFRGICYERSNQWAKAETDLQQALTLFPDQPQVLNYLGYSWIDKGLNLDQGTQMIRKAVEQRPDDGYIVDSLGWAYYRTGKVDEAVKTLERAVDLKPEDPTINDHLGDAYWRVGRQLEAKFQWSHARDLKPEPADLAKIETKLKSGLDSEGTPSADADKTRKSGDGG